MKPAAAVLAATLAVTGLAGTASCASWNASEICTDNGRTECLSSTGGSPDVTTWPPRVSDLSNFTTIPVSVCDQQDTTTASCPIPGNPPGLGVFRILGPDRRCVTATSGTARLVSCNAPGTLFVGWENGYAHGYDDGNGHITATGPYNPDGCFMPPGLIISVYQTSRAGGWAHRRGIGFPARSGAPVRADSTQPACLSLTGQVDEGPVAAASVRLTANRELTATDGTPCRILRFRSSGP